MPAALAGRVTVLALLALAVPAGRAQQPGAPLRKTDLVRLLSGGTLAADELSALVRRNCLSFTPTSRDRGDFVALGADSGLLGALDACARRAATPRTPAPPRPPGPPVSAAATPPAPAPVPSASPPTRPAPLRVALAAARTGFVLGAGQHAAAGARIPLPLMFEARDGSGAPVPGVDVSFTATNARLAVTRVATDSNGRVRLDVVLGPKAGPVVVSAAAGAIERQATLYADPGPTAKLVVRCAGTSVESRVSLAPGVAVVLRVTAQDGFGNPTRVASLQAAAGDRGVLRVTFVGVDSLGGLVRVQPGDEGSTSLVIVASGQRLVLSAAVLRARNGEPPCS